jgi:hypothetical protein
MIMQDVVTVGIEDLCLNFDMPAQECWDKYVDGEIYQEKELVDIINYRNSIEDLRVTFPDGGPGTVLNAVSLYVLCRYFNIKNALETGVANGFYTTFLLSAILKNEGVLTSVDLSTSEGIGMLVPKSYRISDRWFLYKGISSLDFMKKNNMNYDFMCHDSLHTMSHMSKELMEFRRSYKDRFFVFFDDQDAEKFWKRALFLKLFEKKGYTVKYISGNESRLGGHLGGFVQFGRI